MKHLARILAIVGGVAATSPAYAAPVSLTTLGASYAQDFNGLAATGTANTALPTGWAFGESDSNANAAYRAGTGSDNTGDTYSFGAAGSGDRALGGLRSNTLVPTLGVAFRNLTGAAISTLEIAFAGEQWRLGALGRLDKLDFQYSLTATGLLTGSYVDLDALDFYAPTGTGSVGALNGNLDANSTSLSATITGLSIAAGDTFWFRWMDFNATTSDDGLAVDDFSLRASGATGASVPEPGSIALLGVGLLGLAAMLRGTRRRPQASAA